MVMNHCLSVQNQTESPAKTSSTLNNQDVSVAHKYAPLPAVVMYLKMESFEGTVSVDFKIMSISTLFRPHLHNSD